MVVMIEECGWIVEVVIVRECGWIVEKCGWIVVVVMVGGMWMDSV